MQGTSLRRVKKARAWVLAVLLCCAFGVSSGACATNAGGHLKNGSKPTAADTSDKPSPIADYFRRRLADAADIFSLSVGVNIYGAKATISKLGVGLYSTGASLLGPNPFAALVDCGHAFLHRKGFGKSYCRSAEAGLRFGTAGIHRVQDHTILIHYLLSSKTWGAGADRAELVGKFEHKLTAPLDSRNSEDWTQLSVSAGCIVGAHVGFNPGALLDFILGWFGVDIMEDDI